MSTNQIKIESNKDVRHQLIPFSNLNLKCRTKVVSKKAKKIISGFLSRMMLAYEDGDRIHRRIQAQKQEIQQRYMRDIFPRF